MNMNQKNLTQHTSAKYYNNIEAKKTSVNKGLCIVFLSLVS